MKKKNTTLFPILLLTLLFATSCSDKKEDEIGGKPPVEKNTENISINNWIYKEMDLKYYWSEQMPKVENLNLEDEPNKFFYQTLYKYNTAEGDRFSYLEKDGVYYAYDRTQSNSYGVKANELGFEFYTLFYSDIGPVYCVTYVKKGTDAEKKLKRGDIIYRVNTERVTEDNYGSLLDSGKAKYTLEKYTGGEIELITDKTYAENPVFFSNVITSIPNYRIGYVVYNFFTNDSGDNSMAYAAEMNKVLADFKTRNITHLVLDLRYNGGGYVSSGNYIASAIVPNRGNSDTKIYTKRAFNKKYDALQREKSDYESRVTEFFSDNISNGRKVVAEVARLEMEKLYVLTSKYTASASEQIINGLRAYIDVEVIGQTTTGKNMESFAIPGSAKEKNWILHPLTSVSFNKEATGVEDNNYSMGFPPTSGKELDEFEFHSEDNKPSLYQLGNPNEVLLAKAIESITGKQRRKFASKTTIDVRVIGSSQEQKQGGSIIERQ